MRFSLLISHRFRWMDMGYEETRSHEHQHAHCQCADVDEQYQWHVYLHWYGGNVICGGVQMHHACKVLQQAQSYAYDVAFSRPRQTISHGSVSRDPTVY